MESLSHALTITNASSSPLCGCQLWRSSIVSWSSTCHHSVKMQRRGGPYGVGRPQQAAGYVCKRFNLHARTHINTRTYSQVIPCYIGEGCV